MTSRPLPPGRVPKAEANDCTDSVRHYSRYWSRYFDPIGIRFRLADRIEVETCILHSIANNYHWLFSFLRS